MAGISEILENNKQWVASKNAEDPEFFQRLANGQKPKYLFIGCSDSRVPASGITGTGPGEMFVHRNIANLVVHSDMNLLSVLQYAVEVLGVQDILVCGHYGCGGVRAAMATQPLGLIDNWLRHIRDVHLWNRAELNAIADVGKRTDRLAELNVEAQVANVCHTSIVQDAWRRGHPLTVHGWIYSISDGLIRDLGLTAESAEQIPPEHRLY